MNAITLKCRIENIDEFEELSKEIQKRADGLVKALTKLSNLELKIVVAPETKNETNRQIQGSAFDARTDSLPSENYSERHGEVSSVTTKPPKKK